MYHNSKRFRHAIIEKSLVLFGVASVLQNRKERDEIPSHLVTSTVILNSVTSESHTFRAVIDSGSPFNLISQMKVKEMHLFGGTQPKQKPQDIDGNPLLTYFEHKLDTFTTDSTGRIACNTVVFMGADIDGFDVILGRLWLKETRLFINWENDY